MLQAENLQQITFAFIFELSFSICFPVFVLSFISSSFFFFFFIFYFLSSLCFFFIQIDECLIFSLIVSLLSLSLSLYIYIYILLLLLLLFKGFSLFGMDISLDPKYTYTLRLSRSKIW